MQSRVLFPFLNPNWVEAKLSLISAHMSSYVSKFDSNSRRILPKIEIGRFDDARLEGFPGFCSGITLQILQVSGISPDSMILLKLSASILIAASGRAFRIALFILSRGWFFELCNFSGDHSRCDLGVKDYIFLIDQAIKIHFIARSRLTVLVHKIINPFLVIFCGNRRSSFSFKYFGHFPNVWQRRFSCDLWAEVSPEALS